jgi:hypothetical protein
MFQSASDESTGSILKKTDRRSQSLSVDRTLFVLFFMGISAVSFVGGSAVAEFRVFPYPELLRPSFTAVRALQQQVATTSSLRKTDLWWKARYQDRGVVKHLESKSFDGYTFYTSAHTSGAFLIDMHGQIVHEWNVPFRSAWPNPPHVQRPVPERFIFWRRAHLYPNGDVLAIYIAAGDTPWGYGLIKVDRDSNVLWRFADRVHHDFFVHNDGAIFTLTHALRNTKSDPVKGVPHLADVVLDDFVLHLSPDGKALQRVSLLDAIAESPFRHILTPVLDEEWDLLHTNTVKVVTPEFAAHHDFAQPGQVLISLRSREALALLDMQTERVVWAACGPYRRQHDPDLLKNGNILLFDNQGHTGPGGPSRILELDPTTNAIHWTYSGDNDHWLFSSVRSTQQMLPNGNVLITESDGGRILEVTRQGETAWEYHNPAQLDNDPSYVSVVCGAVRVPAGHVKFELKANTGH